MTDGTIASTRRGRKRRKRQDRSLTEGGATPARNAGAAAGTPRFLKRPKPETADVDSAAEREARSSTKAPGTVGERPTTTPLGRAAAEAIGADDSPGQPLVQEARKQGKTGSETDFDAVRVHPESPVAEGFGANAITYGHHIHFAPGAYRPGSAAGDALIGHELTHVAQQDRFGSEGAQFQLLSQSGMATGMGEFDIHMIPQTDPQGRTGVEGTVTFVPDADSPYSNRIGLIQTVDIDKTDFFGTVTDYNWSGTAEANRENLKTPEGTHVDLEHANQPATRESEPWYWEGGGVTPDVPTTDNHFGWNRSGGDVHDAQLYDFPGSVGRRVFEFETVAVGRDSEVIYGALSWGFEVDGRAGTVTNEHAVQSYIDSSGTDQQHQSEDFDAAREKFRDFYIHEPEIVYFDNDQAAPQAGELDKLADAASYLTMHPDVDIELAGSADTRGGSRHNQTLALRRMDAVQAHLISLGVSPARIHRAEATAGESSAEGNQGTLAGSAGSLQANRRVTLRYQRMMSAP